MVCNIMFYVKDILVEPPARECEKHGVTFDVTWYDVQAMAGKTAPSLLELQKDAIKAGTRNAGGGKKKKQ